MADEERPGLLYASLCLAAYQDSHHREKPPVLPSPLMPLEEALTIGTPDIFNTDQGSQSTSRDSTTVLKNHHITIGMDGKGRVFDNIFIERL